MALRIFGIIGIIIGIVCLIGAATGGFNPEPGRGYAIGAILILGGFVRIARAGGR